MTSRRCARRQGETATERAMPLPSGSRSTTACAFPNSAICAGRIFSGRNAAYRSGAYRDHRAANIPEQDKRFLGPLRKPRLRPSDHVFGMEPAAFRRMLYRLKLPPELAALRIHPHMLRHACGFDLVGRADLQARAAFMGHKRLENTVRYSKLAPEQFEGLRP